MCASLFFYYCYYYYYYYYYYYFTGFFLENEKLKLGKKMLPSSTSLRDIKMKKKLTWKTLFIGQG